MKIAVIGLGYWGPNILRILQSISSVEIAYVCDKSPDRLLTYIDKYKCVTDYNTILQDDSVNTVFIVTPISSHFKIIKDCLLSNKNVFVEKPLCKTRCELDELYQISKDKNLSLFCDYTFTHSDKIKKIKTLLPPDEEIIFIEMNREAYVPKLDECVVYDLIPHDLSILYFLFNSSPEIRFVNTLFLGSKNFKSVINLEINKIKCLINVSLINDKKTRSIKIFCKTKIIEYNDTCDIIKIFDFSQSQQRTEEIISINFNEPLRLSIESFLNNIGDKFEYNKQINVLVTDAFEKIF